MVANETNQTKNVTGKRVAAIGRWMPIHYGHKRFLIKLAKNPEFEKVVVMIGSCFENGRQRYCVSAVEREKMITAMFQAEGIPKEKYDIIHIPDVPTFEEWINLISNACKMYGITHFCTGNKEDILDVLKEKNIELNAELINPEEGSEVRYHATEIRKLILEGKYAELEKMIPIETKAILFRNTFKEIIASSKNRGISFVPGRQAVDIVFLVKNTVDGNTYVLLGRRSNKKVDFKGELSLPGIAINQAIFESPLKAAIRGLKEGTGLEVEVLDNSLEPAIIKLKNVPNNNLEQLYYVGIYSSNEEKYAGTRGGSSQCFGIFIEDEIYKYEEYLTAGNDLESVAFYNVNTLSEPLAYQHSEMLEKAINMFEGYPNLKKYERK